MKGKGAIMEKITKKQMFEGMVAYFRGEDTDISDAQFAEFCEAQIADLDKKAAKAKERAAAKRAEADKLTEVVFDTLTDEFKTIAEIAEAVAGVLTEDEAAEVSTQKITARLTKLVKAGDVEKEQVTRGIEGKKKKSMGYKVAGGEVLDEVEDEE